MSVRVWAIVVAVIVLSSAAGLAVWELKGSGSDRAGRCDQTGEFPLGCHYLEARVTSPDAPTGSPYGLIRGWYQAPDKTRWEISCAGHEACDDFPARVLLVVGADFWFYEPETNTYSQGRESYLAMQRPFPLLSNYQPGPVSPGVFDERLQDGLVKKKEELLGIEVINYEDALWIDEEHQFLLKQVGADAGGSRFVVEVTKVDYNPRLEASIFEFKPPSGATNRDLMREPTPRPFPTPGPDATVTVFSSSDFPRPAYLPPGFSQRGSSSGSDSRTGLRYQELRFSNLNSSETISVRQERWSGPPPALPAGIPVTVGAVDGVRWTSGGETALTFTRGDTVVTVRSATVPFEELLRVAGSLP